jgi:hypothetical protein
VTDAPSIQAGLVPLAEIVATVDLERSLADRDRRAHLSAAADDPLLGARVVPITDDDGAAIALAEPTTEGRLAASLARNGEGPAGSYVAVPDGDDLESFRGRAAAAGVGISRVAVGPFGPSVLVLGGPVGGPHLIVVERRSLPSGR